MNDGSEGRLQMISAEYGIHHILLGDVVQRSTPSVAMEAMIRRRLRWCRKLFHSKAVSHCAVREGFLFDLDNCHLLWKFSFINIILVTDDTLCRNCLDVVLCPDIFFSNSLWKDKKYNIKLDAEHFQQVHNAQGTRCLAYLRRRTSNPMMIWCVGR